MYRHDLNHPWDASLEEAKRIQKRLSEKLKLERFKGRIRYIAGVDVSYNRGSDRLFAAVVVLDAKSRKIIEVERGLKQAVFPYVPGYLSFREIPPVLSAFRSLKTPVDLVVCDGQGIAHPRRMGIAAHLGVLTDLPTIGCAKSWLYGNYIEPDSERGSCENIYARDHEIVGQVVRTKDHVKPLLVSPGHRVSLAQATELILEFSGNYRLPTPIRLAHEKANIFRRSYSASA